ncbi:MAG: polysaccharide deacetylase family protein [Polyangiales bacterium]
MRHRAAWVAVAAVGCTTARPAVTTTVRRISLSAASAVAPAPAPTPPRVIELRPPAPVTEPAPAEPPSTTPVVAPQFVLMGLDVTPGADTERTFARRVGDAAEAAGARVTFFTNTQFFLLPPGTHRRRALTAEERRWEDPDPRVIRRIWYARSVREAEGRLATTRYLIEHGHEIASHGVHHERGGAWTAEQWRAEMQTFNRHHTQLLGLPPVEGFRAPYLSPGQGLHPAETSLGVHYDASRVVPLRAWPWRLSHEGPWEIPVMSGRFEGCRSSVFDDALAVCGFTEERLRRALLAEFEARYQGNRAPFVLSAHAGMVEGVYLPILRDVCRRSDVRCVTFADLARYMDAHPDVAGWGRRPSQMESPPRTTP